MIVPAFHLLVTTDAHACLPLDEHAVVHLVFQPSGCSKRLGARGKLDNLDRLPVHDALVLLEVGILPLTRILPGHSFLVALGRPGGVDTCRKPLLRGKLSTRRCRLRCREERDRWLGRRAIIRPQRWWRGSRRWKDDVHRRRLLHWCQRVLG